MGIEKRQGDQGQGQFRNESSSTLEDIVENRA